MIRCKPAVLLTVLAIATALEAKGQSAQGAQPELALTPPMGWNS